MGQRGERELARVSNLEGGCGGEVWWGGNGVDKKRKERKRVGGQAEGGGEDGAE